MTATRAGFLRRDRRPVPSEADLSAMRDQIAARRRAVAWGALAVAVVVVAVVGALALAWRQM